MDSIKAPAATATSPLSMQNCSHGAYLRAFKRSRRVGRRIRAAQAITTDQKNLREKLWEELKRTPESERNGPASPAVLEVLEQMKEAAQSAQVKIVPRDMNGIFKGLLLTSVLIDDDGSTTLGKMTFQQFGPKDLKIFLESGMGGLYQGVEGSDDYAVRTAFKVGEGEHEGLKGLWSVEGNFNVDSEKPDRQNISFSKIRLEPLDKSPEGLKAWLDLTKASNPNMDDEGVVTGGFEQAIHGFRDFIYLDHDHQVTIGNRGAFGVFERKT